ncbi:MAG: catalase [Thermoleophilaceae bacterium]|nr:catalase [Thermoleophilaceae bacterium]
MLSPAQALDIINERFGRHAGYRALHAKGVLCKGTFTATPDAARLTRAAHMQGDPVDATARFSNGSGDPTEPDYEVGVRGLAVKFYLPDGSRTDISAQTVPRFPTRTPTAFMNLLRASAPGPGRLWRLPLFLATHPDALPALRANASSLKPPPSYAARPYYAVHAFKWIGADGGERWVRYRWVPEAPEERISDDEAKALGSDYLQEEIAERLRREPVRFTLELTIAGPGDEVNDPTSVWPAEREKVNAGTLELTGLETGREKEGDVLVFDPVRVTDGIELSNDPILHYRSPAYSVSVERRTGG